jgi:deoxyadenosine/deoxycytidine kinase
MGNSKTSAYISFWENRLPKSKKLKAFAVHVVIVTFKDLRKIIAEKNRKIEIQSKFYNPNYYWKGRKVVSLDQWFQIKENYTPKAALQYFPNEFPSFGFHYILDNIDLSNHFT